VFLPIFSKTAVNETNSLKDRADYFDTTSKDLSNLAATLPFDKEQPDHYRPPASLLLFSEIRPLLREGTQEEVPSAMAISNPGGRGQSAALGGGARRGGRHGDR